jgi:hypothetical protein
MRLRVRRDVGSRRDHSRPDLPRLRARVHRDMERLGLPPGAGHPTCGHAVPAASPAGSGLTLLQLHAGAKSVGSGPEDPLLSVLPFAPARHKCQFSLHLAGRNPVTCGSPLTSSCGRPNASQSMWRILGTIPAVCARQRRPTVSRVMSPSPPCAVTSLPARQGELSLASGDGAREFLTASWALLSVALTGHVTDLFDANYRHAPARLAQVLRTAHVDTR